MYYSAGTDSQTVYDETVGRRMKTNVMAKQESKLTFIGLSGEKEREKQRNKVANLLLASSFLAAGSRACACLFCISLYCKVDYVGIYRLSKLSIGYARIGLMRLPRKNSHSNSVPN